MADFKKKIYTLNDITKKRKYILGRLKKIYKNIDNKKLEMILDKIKIYLREQDEKGASNHKKRKVYIGFKMLERYDIKNEKDFLKYLSDAESPLTHEVTHIFQNIFDAFPHVQYIEEKKDGETEINYEKYVSDPGEIQSRIEHILELMKWGFEKNEIIELLYSRKYKDKNLWKDLVNKAREIKKLK